MECGSRGLTLRRNGDVRQRSRDVRTDNELGFGYIYLKGDSVEPLRRLSKCELRRGQGKSKSVICRAVTIKAVRKSDIAKGGVKEQGRGRAGTKTDRLAVGQGTASRGWISERG